MKRLLIVLLLSANVAVAEPKPLISGAILYTRTANLTMSDPIINVVKEPITEKHLRIRDKKIGKNKFQEYSRKNDMCKRAKIKTIIKKHGKGVLCAPNWQISAVAQPNDTYFTSQFALKQIYAPGAWDTTTGNDAFIVAVVDTGVDYNHKDLARNMWKNPNEIVGNGLDDDKNGYVDDVYGINAVANTGNPLDDNGHGSHVAGTIGAHSNNSLGIAGVAWNVKILATKFLNSSGSGSLANAIKCLSYVNKMKKAGHKIVATNNSWGGGSYSQALRDVIEESRQLGIVFVAAAGNSATNNDKVPFYPASYQVGNVISVASVTSSSKLSSFSNYGATSVHIAAPGSTILSTLPKDAYGYKSGTSMAAPHVAGAVVLTQAACSGELSSEQVKTFLVQNGTVLDVLRGMVSSGSMLNTQASTEAAQQFCNATPTPIPTATITAAPDTTPQPTPTPTATATPTATDTPNSKPRVVFSPRSVAVGKLTTMTVENIPTTLKSVRLRFVMVDARGSQWACLGKTIDLTKGNSISINLPQEATTFASIHTNLYVPTEQFAGALSIEGTKVLRGSSSAARAVCTNLESQLRNLLSTEE